MWYFLETCIDVHLAKYQTDETTILVYSYMLQIYFYIPSLTEVRAL